MKNDNTLNNEVINQLVKLARLHGKTAEATMSRPGFHHSQHKILLMLKKAGDCPLSQKKLAEALGVTPAAVTVALRKMEQSGLISRASDSEDSRKNNIELTEKGNRLLEDSRLLFDEINRAMFDTFTDDEKNRIISNLKKMQENLESFRNRNKIT